MKRCQKTHKVRFRDELSAKIALARRQWLDRGERRAYRCPFCHGWHLTSQPQRSSVEGAANDCVDSQPSQEKKEAPAEAGAFLT